MTDEAKQKKSPDPHVCKRCSELSSTCCRLTPGEEDVCFPLSQMERERILECVVNTGAFTIAHNSKPFVDNIKRMFPREKELVDQLFPECKQHFRLATHSDGACVFLGTQGCVLPREARPYYCQLFPFWFSGERLTYFTTSDCLAVRECRTKLQMLELFRIAKAELKLLHGRLRLAWGLPPKEGMPLLEHAFSRYKSLK